MSSPTTTVGKDTLAAGAENAPAAGRLHKAKEGHSPMESRRRRLFWPFIIPALVVYTVIMMVPTVASVWISFHKWDGITPMQPRGIKNYTQLLHDPTFLTSLKNTLVILFIVGAAVFVISFALTMLLRDMRGRKFARSVLFFPNIVSALALAILWGFLFQYDGLLDAIFKALGMSSPDFIANDLFSVICLGLIWTSTGFYVTIIMAGVDQIPPYLYEECALAGANAWQRFRYVTFPLTWDVIATAAVLWTINSLKVFDFIYAFGGTTIDLPPTKVWNTAVFIYARTFGGHPPSYQYGYASAAAILTLVAVMALVLLMRRLFKREAIQL